MSTSHVFENYIPPVDCAARYAQYSKLFDKNAQNNANVLEIPDIIQIKSYQFIGSCLYKLKTSDSWRGRKDADCTFTKEEKEALNAMIFYILLVKRQIEENKPFNANACIAYLIKRIIRKACTWDAKPENKEDIRRKSGHYDECEKYFVHKQFMVNSNKEFVDFLDVLAAQMSDEERELFSVAKNQANLVEFEQIKDIIFDEDVVSVAERLKRDAKRHNTDLYFDANLEHLIKRLSWSRNIVRWQGYGAPLACNILCHMLETAIFAWMMAIEENTVYGGVRFDPGKAFGVGLFHDIAEIWTDDVPSPCKDNILDDGVAIRGLLAEQEKEALRKYFYTAFSNNGVVEYFKANVMLEEIEDEGFHKFMKKADYFSADYEVFWNIVIGFKHYRFLEILETSNCKERRTVKQVELLSLWIDKIKKNEFLTP